MKLARVSGTVVSTISAEVYQQRRMLICDLLDAYGQPQGGYLIAVDNVDAGVGDMVLIVDEGNSARQVISQNDAPIRAVIVGIVDQVELSEQTG